LLEDLVEADAEEIAEHQLGDRPKTGDGGAGGGAHDSAFGDWRVDDARLTELTDQPLRDAEHPAIGITLPLGRGAPGDILADDDDTRVAAHLLAQRFIQRLADRFLRHQSLPKSNASPRRAR